MEPILLDYPETLLELKKRINLAQYKSFSAVNAELILLYLDIGKVISQKIKLGWGESVVDTLSKDLQTEYIGIKGFSSRNLRRMRFIFDEINDNSIWPQLVAKLPWGHTDLIFSKLKDLEKRTFYLQKCVERGWSRSILEEEIKFDSFTKQINFQSNFENTIENNDKIIDYRLSFKDEYDLSFLNLEDTHSEKELELAIVDNISKTLGQFGSDFAFMGRQFKLDVDDKEYFVDLLFYHRKLKSMIAIELKTTEFKPEHSQQLNWYLHILDKTIKYSEDNQSIGILLCKSKSKLTVEYALEMANNPMGIVTYNYKQLPREIAKFLPDENQLAIIFNQAEKLNDR